LNIGRAVAGGGVMTKRVHARAECPRSGGLGGAMAMPAFADVMALRVSGGVLAVTAAAAKAQL
jgi:hypothetical protein